MHATPSAPGRTPRPPCSVTTSWNYTMSAWSMVVGRGSYVRCAMASKSCPSTAKYHRQPLRQPHSASQDGGHCLTIHYYLALSLLFTFLLSAHYSYPCSQLIIHTLALISLSFPCSHLAIHSLALILPLLSPRYSHPCSKLTIHSLFRTLLWNSLP